MSVRRRPEMLNSLGEPAFIIDYRDEHGRRKQIRTEATTLKDARLIEASILTKVELAKRLPVPKQALEAMTVERFTLDVYLPAVELEVKPKTYEGYEVIVKDLNKYFGKMTLASIEPLTIDDYFDSRGNEITQMGRPPGAGTLRNRRF